MKKILGIILVLSISFSLFASDAVPIVCSDLGEKQTLLGSISIALDSWMFKSSLLEMMQEQEK